MTDADLEQLLTAATPGPWFSYEWSHDLSIYQSGTKPAYQGRIADVIYWSENHSGGRCNPLKRHAQANARLIAFAPTLAQEVLDLRAEVARLREALEFYADKAFDGYDVSITDYGMSTELGEIITDGGDRARAALGEKNDDL